VLRIGRDKPPQQDNAEVLPTCNSEAMGKTPRGNGSAKQAHGAHRQS
jgi:hypothetical protein